MSSGGFNRVIGLDVKRPNDIETPYIVRIPRYEMSDIANENASLRFVREYTTISVPRVVAINEPTDNPLEARYSVQTRGPVGFVYRQLLNVRSETPSRIYYLPGLDQKARHISPSAPFFVEHLQAKFPDRSRAGIPGPPKSKFLAPFKPGPPSQSTADVLKALFAAAEVREKKKTKSDIAFCWEEFREMTAELQADGRFKSMCFTLTHGDLHPRNILLNLSPDSHGSPMSVLDWNEGLFAPAFMACKPPMWLWARANEEEEDERHANDVPSNPENREIKEIFEQAAGSTYLQLVYQPQYRLAERLVVFAINGMNTTEHLQEAIDMLDE
ncbi:hypothetical protein OQA88_9450 [Cercophora sp. LCS_1]